MDKQPENKPTMYDEFKKASDPYFESYGKTRISKAGLIDDGKCPLSTNGFCNVAKEQGRSFHCDSNWWKSCTIYLKNKEVE